MTDPCPHLELPEVRELVSEWRVDGLRIGWTNGCFDIIHAGHVEMLTFARRNCDRLIVGVNSDASVRKLKGEGRPYHTLAERLTVLRELRSVNVLLTLAHDTPVHEIRALRPDIAIKDDSYLNLPMPERPVIEDQGGTVLLFPRVEGLSSTRVIRVRGWAR